MPGAGLGLIWLDGRAMGSAEGHDAHGASEGAMSVRFGTFDAAWKQTSEMPVDLRVCECCPTTAAMTSDGPVVAYRNRSEDEIRDIYVARLENGTVDGTQGRARRQLEDCRLSRERPDAERAWTQRRARVVHRQGRRGPRLRRVLVGRRPHVRRPDSS